MQLKTHNLFEKFLLTKTAVGKIAFSDGGFYMYGATFIAKSVSVPKR